MKFIHRFECSLQHNWHEWMNLEALVATTAFTSLPTRYSTFSIWFFLWTNNRPDSMCVWTMKRCIRCDQRIRSWRKWERGSQRCLPQKAKCVNIYLDFNLVRNKRRKKKYWKHCDRWQTSSVPVVAVLPIFDSHYFIYRRGRAQPNQVYFTSFVRDLPVPRRPLCSIGLKCQYWSKLRSDIRLVSFCCVCASARALSDFCHHLSHARL